MERFFYEYWMSNSAAIFLVCLLATGLLIPRILHVAFSKNLFDEVGGRKIHKGHVPRLGGMAFVPVIIFSVMLSIAVNLSLGYEAIPNVFLRDPQPLLYSGCALLMLYIVGLGDDLVGVRYRTKFVVQVFCAVMLLAGGLGVDNFGGLFGLYALPCGVTWLMTIMTVVLIINAVNLIDGIDGLASGLSAIALGFFAAIFYIHGVYDCAMIALATMGVVLSFFYYNVFGDAAKYKKIFMGDTGSLTLGFILTCLAFRALHLPVTVGPFPNINRFVLAFAPLLVPCFDVVRVFIVRLSLRHNPFMPDRRHLHHAMMAAGLPHRHHDADTAHIGVLHCGRLHAGRVHQHHLRAGGRHSPVRGHDAAAAPHTPVAHREGPPGLHRGNFITITSINLIDGGCACFARPLFDCRLSADSHSGANADGHIFYSCLSQDWQGREPCKKAPERELGARRSGAVKGMGGGGLALLLALL